MFKQFFPDRYMTSTYAINFKNLYKEGFRGVIFDIDNTLVEHGAPADERSKKLLNQLKKSGFKIMLLSNNKEPRVKMFNDEVQVSYIHKAGKPGIKGYKRAMHEMGTVPGNTVFVGDQLFTDVWGAKNAGIYSILVKPINKKEEIQIVLKRYLERIVLFAYKRECRLKGKPYLWEESYGD